MIVTCEQCRTQFQLDDGRILPDGVRVRCSLCKHAFLVRPTAADDDGDSLERLAAPEAPASAAEPAPQRVAAGSEPELESDWEFNDDPPFGLAGDELGGPEPSLELEAAPEQSSGPASGDMLRGWLEEGDGGAELGDPERDNPELGNPEEWDFFAAGPEEAAETPIEPLPPPGADVLPAVETDRFELAAHDLEPDGPDDLAPRLARVGRAAHAAGALATALLFAAGAYAGLRPRLSEAPPIAMETRVAGLEVEHVDGRWIDNLAEGPLLVVSGVLRNPGAEAAAGATLALRLADAAGVPLDAPSAAVGPALPEADLRERSAAALAEHQAQESRRFASRWLAPGEGWRFHAVFAEVPPAAVRLRFAGLAAPSSEAFPR